MGKIFSRKQAITKYFIKNLKKNLKLYFSPQRPKDLHSIADWLKISWRIKNWWSTIQLFPAVRMPLKENEINTEKKYFPNISLYAGRDILNRQ